MKKITCYRFESCELSNSDIISTITIFILLLLSNHDIHILSIKINREISEEVWDEPLFIEGDL